jgi:hypothetical protein
MSKVHASPVWHVPRRPMLSSVARPRFLRVRVRVLSSSLEASVRRKCQKKNHLCSRYLFLAVVEDLYATSRRFEHHGARCDYAGLECCDLGEGGGPALAEALRLNTTVTSLDLGFNRLGEGGGRALAEGKILFRNGELNLLLPGSGCPLQAGTGHGRPGQAPGRCGCAVTSLLQRDCGGAVC